MLSFMWTLLSSLLLTALLAECHPVGPPSVQLRNTTLTGANIQASNVEFFGGIPYAEPPVKALRFSPPVPKYSLSPLRSFDARNFGSTCLQPLLSPPPIMSEDCLTINVFRPSGVGVDSSLPVMVWIYGGGFQYGASSSFDGTPLVNKSMDRGTPILFVSMNYRLGPLGFPQGPEAVKRGALNLGLHDQRVALQWVQHNIGSFGGDPRKVTVFGQSAGAMSTSYHYLNNDFSTVARAAIFESGTASSLPVFNASRDFPSWELFEKSIQSCAIASPDNKFPCLRSASELEIIAAIKASLAIEAFPFRPILDGPGGILSDSPAKRLTSGAGGRVPLMIGTVLDEGTSFVPPGLPDQEIPLLMIANATPSPLGADSLKAAIDKVVSLYPEDPSAGSPFGTGNQTFGAGTGFKRAAAIIGDTSFQAPRRFWSQTIVAPSYAYIFTDPQTTGNPADGVFHTAELPYLFGNVSTAAPPKVANLSRMMLDYWISFAVSLDPNDNKGTSRPHWGKYEKKAKEILELNSSCVHMIPDDYRAKAIDAIIDRRDDFSW